MTSCISPGARARAEQEEARMEALAWLHERIRIHRAAGRHGRAAMLARALEDLKTEAA